MVRRRGPCAERFPGRRGPPTVKVERWRLGHGGSELPVAVWWHGRAPVRMGVLLVLVLVLLLGVLWVRLLVVLLAAPAAVELVRRLP